MERMGDEKVGKKADTHKVEGNGGEENRNSDCIKSDLERVEEEWRKAATDGRNWRLLIVVRERREEEKRQRKRKSRSTHPNDSDANKRKTTQ